MTGTSIAPNPSLQILSSRNALGVTEFQLQHSAGEHWCCHRFERDEIDAFQVNHFTEELAKQHADWVATIEVNGCDGDRAFEIASLSTDLAITALQLAAPYMGTKNMSRLATHRGPISS